MKTSLIGFVGMQQHHHKPPIVACFVLGGMACVLIIAVLLDPRSKNGGAMLQVTWALGLSLLGAGLAAWHLLKRRPTDLERRAKTWLILVLVFNVLIVVALCAFVELFSEYLRPPKPLGPPRPPAAPQLPPAESSACDMGCNTAAA